MALPAYTLSSDLSAGPTKSRWARWTKVLHPDVAARYSRLRRACPTKTKHITRLDLSRLLRCSTNDIDATLGDLVTTGLLDVLRKEGGRGMWISVRELPRKLPSANLSGRGAHGEEPAELLAEYSKACKKYTGEPPRLVRGKDFKIARRLLDAYPLDKLAALARDYFEDASKGVVKYPSFGHFSTSITELIVRRGPVGFASKSPEKKRAKLEKELAWALQRRREIKADKHLTATARTIDLRDINDIIRELKAKLND